MDTTKPVAGEEARSTTSLSPWAGFVLALLAASVTFVAIQAMHPIFHVGKEFDVPNIGSPKEMFDANKREQDKVNRWHAMVYVGGLGLLVALALGAGEAANRRFRLVPFLAAPLGASGGALGGLLASLAVVYVREKIGQAELTHTIGTQLLLGVPLGLGVGLGVGFATRSIFGTLKAGFAGLAAGGLAAALYPVLLSILLPATSTDTLLPEETIGLVLWLAVFAGLLGAIIPIASRGRSAKKPKGA